ncbi:MAG: CHAT domain-containing protein [Pyrinomonadaceae bacterium]
MNNLIGDPNLLRDYLLGNVVDEGVRTQIEERLITDEDFALAIEAVESDLMEAYLDHEFGSREEKRFERFFLTSPTRQRQLRLTENLREFSASAGKRIPPAKRSLYDRFPTSSTQWLRFAALALVVFGSVVAIWYGAFRRTDADKGLAYLREAYRGQRLFEPRFTVLSEYAPISDTRGTQKNVSDPEARRRAEQYMFYSTQDSSDPRAHQGLALIYIADKKHDQAVHELNLAAAASPNNAAVQSDAGAAYLTIARSLDREKDADRFFELVDISLRQLDRAVELAPKLPEAHFNRALALEAAHSHDLAAKAWAEYLELDPSSKWADEARQHLKTLQDTTPRERSAEQLEADYLEAIRQGNEGAATQLLNANRELIREKYLPQRLAMSYLRAPDERRDELLKALRYTGELELKLTGDPFANEIARFYSTLPDVEAEILRQAHADFVLGSQECLDQRWPKALGSFQKAHAGFEKVGDRWEAALAAYFIGYSQISDKKVAEGIVQLEKLTLFARSGGYLWLESSALYWLGGGTTKLSYHTKARQYFERALTISERLNDSYAVQRNLLGLARLSSLGGLRRQALGYVLRILRESSGREVSFRQRYRSLGAVFTLLSNLNLDHIARIVALEAVSAAEVSGDQMNLARAPADAGIAFTQLGEFEEAGKWLERAGEQARAIADEKLRTQMIAYSDLRMGDLERKRGHFAESEAFYERAIQYYETAALPSHLADAHKGRLLAAIAAGHEESIDGQIRENIRIAENYRKTILEEQERSGFFDSSESVYEIAADFEYRRGNMERSYDYAETFSSRSLLDWLQKGAMVAQDANAKKILLSDEAQPLGLTEIRVRMPVGTQVLQYSVLDDKVLIWLVSRQKFIVRAVPIERDRLGTVVSHFTGLVSRSDTRSQSEIATAARELYDLLIAPVRSEIDADKEICLVPSKMLYTLPFAALVSPAGKPLIADFDLIYSPSANVFLHCSAAAAGKAPVSDERLLAIGNPAFDRRTFDSLPDLPAAEAEAKTAASFYSPRSKTIKGPAATKSAVLNAMPGADVIHFASHYVVTPELPISSYLLLAKNGGEAENSMLTNVELAGKKLPRTRVVVLAACRSGVEAYSNSEGLVGLSRTLLAAGVPLVVGSLWNVDSEATSELMSRFHRFRREKLSTARALRRAQLELFNDGPGRYNSPYYWSAFALFGGHADF